MTFKQLHWSQKTAYSLVALCFLSAPIHFILPNKGDIAAAIHFVPVVACAVVFVVCMILGLQTQPREMRPALFSLLAMIVHWAAAMLVM